MSLPLPPSKFVHWLKIISKFVSVQIVVQALTLVSGLWIVRSLDKEQYAYYTIAITMLATMNLLADSGIGISLSAIGGRVWQDPYRFGQLINTAMQLRYFLAAISITLVTPFLMWILMRNGAALDYTFILTIIVLIGVNFELTNGVLIVVPRLHSQISQIQKIDLILNFSKIALLGVAFLTILNAAVATALGTIGFGIERFFLGRLITENIDRKASVNQQDRAEIIENIKKSAPTSIFYCFQGQITVFLISIFGNAQNVAELGALGRLSVIFSVIGSVMTAIILPSFTRCQLPKLLLSRYFQIMLTISIFSLALVCLSVFFPGQILWVIGEKYAHLKSELVLVMFSAGLYLIVNSMWSINASKAWISKVWLQIPGTILAQIGGILLVDLSTLKGAILFGMFPLIPGIISNLYMTYKGLRESSQNI